MVAPLAIAGIAGAGLSLLGGLTGAQISAEAQERQQIRQLAWEREKLKLEQDYNTRMANSAHQREIADLKAAGINPILTAQGQGAASPTAQGGSISALQDQSGQIIGNAMTQAGGYIQSALTTERQMNIEENKTNAEIAYMRQQGAESAARTIKELSQSKTLDKQALEHAASAALMEQKAANEEKQRVILNAEINNLELKKRSLLLALEQQRQEIKNAHTQRERTIAETKFTNTKEELFKVAHIASVVAGTATGIAGITGAIANIGKIANLFKITKVAGFVK